MGLVGFNTNVPYRGCTFHVQTEDLGPEIPRIITSLFGDGGRIVYVAKFDYRKHLDHPHLPRVLMKAMKAQHAGIANRLIIGGFTEQLESLGIPLGPPEPPRTSTVPPLFGNPGPSAKQEPPSSHSPWSRAVYATRQQHGLWSKADLARVWDGLLERHAALKESRVLVDDDEFGSLPPMEGDAGEEGSRSPPQDFEARRDANHAWDRAIERIKNGSQPP